MLCREYMAGFFDGEGSIGMYRTRGSKSDKYLSGFKSPSWVRTVSVTNTYKPTLEAYQEKFGGRIACITKRTSPNKRCYQWILGGKKEIHGFLTHVFEYLEQKREQAIWMIGECMGTYDSAVTAKKLKELKRRIHVA